jgi:hypothetical protein
MLGFMTNLLPAFLLPVFDFGGIFVRILQQFPSPRENFLVVLPESW